MSTLPKPTLPLNTDFGPYHLVKLIAVGGMAEIYLARTKGVAGFEKMLALKVIHPDYADDHRFVQMLVDEAKLAVKLNHANIAQTFDLGKINNTYFISMEFVDGGDFFKILKGLTDRDEEIPIEAALLVTRDACSGLDYAHNKADAQGRPLKIIHRDISPQNILLSRHGEVKLVDFGIAKAANVSSKTRAGVIKGKLVYMSPEQSWGEQVDQRTDIFSAGIVLYESLTGGSLYMEQNPVKLLELVRKADIRPPSTLRPDIEPDLDGIVMKALARNPDDRFQTAREFGSAVGEYLRRFAPDFGASQLGALVEAVIESKPIASAQPRQRRPRPSVSGGRAAGAMDRGDFAVHQHSVIFSAEDMMDSLPPGAYGAPKRPVARLVLLDDDGPKPFDLGEQFIIGRSGDLRLADGRVSRRHARIVFHEGAYLLEDLNSSNGTFLNEQRVDQIRRLHSGDTVRIGPFEMRFVIEDAVDDAPAAPIHQERLPTPLTPDDGSVADLPPTRGVEALPHSGAGASRALPELGGRPSVPNLDPRRPPEDLTTNQPQAVITVKIGDEQLILPVERNLPLDHSLTLGERHVHGVASTLVRRPDGYWLEPNPNRDAVQLNGRPLSRPTQLATGDRVTLGPLEVQFQIET